MPISFKSTDMKCVDLKYIDIIRINNYLNYAQMMRVYQTKIL